MYSVDSGTRELVVPEKLGVGVDDERTEDPVAEVAF